jgi:hypothetical protein
VILQWAFFDLELHQFGLLLPELAASDAERLCQRISGKSGDLTRVRFKLMFFGLPETKCRNAASGDSPNTINLGNALGKLKRKISSERARHFFATKRRRNK